MWGNFPEQTAEHPPAPPRCPAPPPSGCPGTPPSDPPPPGAERPAARPSHCFKGTGWVRKWMENYAKQQNESLPGSVDVKRSSEKTMKTRV